MKALIIILFICFEFLCCRKNTKNQLGDQIFSQDTIDTVLSRQTWYENGYKVILNGNDSRTIEKLIEYDGNTIVLVENEQKDSTVLGFTIYSRRKIIINGKAIDLNSFYEKSTGNKLLPEMTFNVQDIVVIRETTFLKFGIVLYSAGCSGDFCREVTVFQFTVNYTGELNTEVLDIYLDSVPYMPR